MSLTTLPPELKLDISKFPNVVNLETMDSLGFRKNVGIGLTRAHHIGLIVPLLAAFSPFWLSKYTVFPGIPMPFNAVLSGAIVAVICYILFQHVPMVAEKNALAKAVLCGLLVAEIMVLKPFDTIPTMTTITLWLFFYFNTMEKEGGHS